MSSNFIPFLLCLVLPEFADARKAISPEGQIIGFTCTDELNSVRRINVDLRRSSYQSDGEPYRRVYELGESIIVLRGPNPDLMNTPMGPIFYTESLDRRSLLLTEISNIPDRNVQRNKQYRCTIGPAIDFAAGRQF